MQKRNSLRDVTKKNILPFVTYIHFIYLLFLQENKSSKKKKKSVVRQIIFMVMNLHSFLLFISYQN